MTGHAPRNFLVNVIECVLSQETRIVMVKGLGSEGFEDIRTLRIG